MTAKRNTQRIEETAEQPVIRMGNIQQAVKPEPPPPVLPPPPPELPPLPHCSQQPAPQPPPPPPRQTPVPQ
ncbi:hypothetical protein FN846DRAFT_902112 [Sphaerosporella brunnea]|uniref:Uncharacterized protein n=1 Tax=Sphaerosporella brunnea TaxID=1250544 RepID=A0A5J5FAW8_9PEZI|nr:hypothetical protein FN846DRAFT_902112 [Sphaerosporella brunnea]